MKTCVVGQRNRWLLRIVLLGILCLAPDLVVNGQALAQPIHPATSGHVAFRMQTWEQILGRAYPDRFRQPITAGELVFQLSRMGLPTVLDTSAVDDSLDERQFVTLPVPSEPLRVRLLHALRQQNGTITMRGGLVRVISLDDAEDDDFLMTVIYDVSGLTRSGTQTIELAQSIRPDAWMDSGSGLGTLHLVVAGLRSQLVVTQSYEVHLELRDMLAGLQGPAGSPRRAALRGQARVPAGPSQFSSRPVMLPTPINSLPNGRGVRVYRLLAETEQQAAENQPRNKRATKQPSRKSGGVF